MVECIVRYYGNVQGVGFRYVAKELMKGRPITGYVKNLHDGSVELLAQGEKAAIESALLAVRTKWGSAIQKEELSWREQGKPRSDFLIIVS